MFGVDVWELGSVNRAWVDLGHTSNNRSTDPGNSEVIQNRTHLVVEHHHGDDELEDAEGHGHLVVALTPCLMVRGCG